MMEIPKTYAQWVDMLDILKDGSNDSDVILLMQKGTIEWQTGVAERFMNRVVETLNIRLKRSTDKFQKAYSNSREQESLIVQALLTLRKELAFLYQIVNLPAIPKDYREQYCTIIAEQADEIQKTLEDSARKNRNSKLESIIRNHRVNNLG